MLFWKYFLFPRFLARKPEKPDQISKIYFPDEPSAIISQAKLGEFIDVKVMGAKKYDLLVEQI